MLHRHWSTIPSQHGESLLGVHAETSWEAWVDHPEVLPTIFVVPSLKLTYPLKMDGWKTFAFPFAALCLFSGALARWAGFGC